MKKIKYVVFLMVMFATVNLFAYSPWDSLVQHLNTCFSYGNIESYTIENVINGTISFSVTSQPTLYPNNELIIKKSGSNPLASETVGFAKFLGFFNGAGSAKTVYNITNVSKGDILLKPYSRKVVLFTNVKEKYSFKPYIDLQQALTFNNFTIFEINSPEEIKFLNPQEYNVLVRLEVSNGLLTGKITSLYNNEILFNQVYQFPFKVDTNFQPNVKISFNAPKVFSRFYSRQLAKEKIIRNSSSRNAGDFSFTTGKNVAESELSITGDFQMVKYNLDRKAVRLVAADVDGDGKEEFVLLNDYGIYVYKIMESDLKMLSVFSFSDSDIIAIHLHKGDFNKNGKDELFVTLTRKIIDVDEKHNKLCSMILEYKGNHRFNVINKNLEYYLRVVEDRNGIPHLICQEEGEYEPYAGDIYEMKWSGSHFKVSSPYQDAKNVYSIYGFAPHPKKRDYTLIIDKFGNIAGYYAPKEEKVELLDENMGVYNLIKYPVKLNFEYYKGGFDKVTSRDVMAYRRLEYRKDFNNQVFTIKTSYNKDITRKIISKVFGRGNEPDKVVGIRWIGNSIIKTWESNEFFETVYDFTFLKENGKDMLAILMENSDNGFSIKIFK
jgi:hypothetical protein